MSYLRGDVGAEVRAFQPDVRHGFVGMLAGVFEVFA
jgi:hypothetical protein